MNLRVGQLQTLSKIVKVGDSNAARHLMTFLRNSWEYVKIRGPDTDIKEGVCNLLFNLMAFKDNEKIDFLVRAIHHPMIHIQRDRIGPLVSLFVSTPLSCLLNSVSFSLRRTHRGLLNFTKSDDTLLGICGATEVRRFGT